jgi:hypothetical protein
MSERPTHLARAIRTTWEGLGTTGRKRPSRRRQPQLEQLEDRIVLNKSFNPTILTDSSATNQNTLRGAVNSANNDGTGGTDTITLCGGVTYTLSQQPLGADDGKTGDLHLTNTKHKLIIQGGGSCKGTAMGKMTTIDAGSARAGPLMDRLFQVFPGVTVEFDNLILTGGRARDDGVKPGDAAGGALLAVNATVTLNNVTLQMNEAAGANGTGIGGSGADAQGGAIFVSGGTLTLNNDLITRNTAVGGSGSPGGGAGTVAGNGGSASGGGIYTTTATVKVINSPLSLNVASGGVGGGGGVDANGFGGDGGAGGDANGGGLIADGGNLTFNSAALFAAPIAGNTARGGDGGAGGNAGPDGDTGFAGSCGNGGNAGNGVGGGLLFDHTAVVTFMGLTNLLTNTASGGAGGQGGIGGNPGGNAGAGGGALGGGIYTETPVSLGPSSQLVANRAVGGAGGPGGYAFNLPGGPGEEFGFPFLAQGGTGGPGGTAQGGGVYGIAANVTLPSALVELNEVIGGNGGASGGSGTRGHDGDGVTGTPGAPGGLALGGGLFAVNASTLTVTNSTVSRNSVQGGRGGDGGNGGAATNGNGGPGGPGGDGGQGLGGGIEAAEGIVMNLTTSTVDSNSSTGGAGGNGGAGNAGSNVGGVGGGGGRGGDALGGGFFVGSPFTGGPVQAEVNVLSSTISNNAVAAGDGGFGNNGGAGDTGGTGGPGGDSGDGQGGGLFFDKGAGLSLLINSTIAGNEVRGFPASDGGNGGMGGPGSQTVQNGDGGDGGNGGAMTGGGIFVSLETDLSLRNDTIAGNSVADSSGGQPGAGYPGNAIQGGFKKGSGGGVAVLEGGNVDAYNTLIALNTALVAPDFQGAFTLALHNLLGDTTGASNISPGAPDDNLVGVGNPGIAPLANYGGPTETMKLLANSPAIGKGENDLALDANLVPLATDQRGKPRIAPPGGVVDIGAVENQGPADNCGRTGCKPSKVSQSGHTLLIEVGDATQAVNIVDNGPRGISVAFDGMTPQTFTGIDQVSVDAPTASASIDYQVSDPDVRPADLVFDIGSGDATVLVDARGGWSDKTDPERPWHINYQGGDGRDQETILLGDMGTPLDSRAQMGNGDDSYKVVVTGRQSSPTAGMENLVDTGNGDAAILLVAKDVVRPCPMDTYGLNVTTGTGIDTTSVSLTDVTDLMLDVQANLGGRSNVFSANLQGDIRGPSGLSFHVSGPQGNDDFGVAIGSAAAEGARVTTRAPLTSAPELSAPLTVSLSGGPGINRLAVAYNWVLIAAPQILNLQGGGGVNDVRVTYGIVLINAPQTLRCPNDNTLTLLFRNVIVAAAVSLDFDSMGPGGAVGTGRPLVGLSVVNQVPPEPLNGFLTMSEQQGPRTDNIQASFDFAAMSQVGVMPFEVRGNVALGVRHGDAFFIRFGLEPSGSN